MLRCQARHRPARPHRTFQNQNLIQASLLFCSKIPSQSPFDYILSLYLNPVFHTSSVYINLSILGSSERDFYSENNQEIQSNYATCLLYSKDFSSFIMAFNLSLANV